jgi:hypothetical protein
MWDSQQVIPYSLDTHLRPSEPPDGYWGVAETRAGKWLSDAWRLFWANLTSYLARYEVLTALWIKYSDRELP